MGTLPSASLQRRNVGAWGNRAMKDHIAAKPQSEKSVDRINRIVRIGREAECCTQNPDNPVNPVKTIFAGNEDLAY